MVKVIEHSKTIEHKQRVAAYARVSTDSDEQENSLDNQIAYYKGLIKSNPEYELVDIYYDFGISGYKEKRPGFQKMMEDARLGRIDLIITKSITRFARNTDTVLKATRELKELGIGVLFELQNINTMTSEGELLMTVFAAFGQAESDAASDNSRLTFQRKMREGKPDRHLEKSFGYRLAGDGEFVPDQDAKWVVKMYELAAEGYKCSEIAKYLNDNNVKTKLGGRFVSCNVGRILRSVIYKGDYVMQQTYTDHNRKRRVNYGERPKTYITDDHQRIVSNKLWNKVQQMLDERDKYLATGSVVEEPTEENYPYMNHLFCAKCGYKLSRKIYSEGNRMSWVCSGNKSYTSHFCEGISIPDSVIRSWGDIKGDIYISKETDELGKTTYKHVTESTWLREHKKKRPMLHAPALSLENYPFLGKVFCKKCGSPLTRRVNGSGKVRWACSGCLQKGKAFCDGIVIPDDILQRVGEPKVNIYIGKELVDGEERYGYTEKPDKE